MRSWHNWELLNSCEPEQGTALATNYTAFGWPYKNSEVENVCALWQILGSSPFKWFSCLFVTTQISFTLLPTSLILAPSAHLSLLSIPHNCSHPLSLRGNTTSKGWFLPMSTPSSPTRICKSIFRTITQQNHLATSWRQKSTPFTPCSSSKFPGCLLEHGTVQIMKKNYFREKLKTKHQFPSKISQNHQDLLHCNFAETN